jgi:hypothetical protein
MQLVRAMRLRVKEGETAPFEAAAAAQVEKVRAGAEGVVFYVVVRRTESGSFFSDPLPGTVEYLLLAAAKDEAGARQLAENESDALFTHLAVAPEVERIDEPEWCCGVTREMVWSPASMWRLSLYRMRVKPNEGELEEGAAKMIARVRDLEPDPRIYTLIKRKGASSLLPGKPSNRDEYIRFHAYQDEDAGLNWHYTLDAEWWAGFYQSRLDGPLEAQQIFRDDILAGFTRDHIWGNPTEYQRP